MTKPTGRADTDTSIAEFLRHWLDGKDGCRAALASGGARTRSEVQALLSQIEAEVAARPERAFTYDDTGRATLKTSPGAWSAGRFETPTLAELKTRLSGAAADPGPVRLSVLLGADPLTDIGTLQASSDGHALFQVASQFNCLESPGPHISKIRTYPGDPTQGPRAAVSAFPGTFLRHYQAPDGHAGRFVQGRDGEIDLLADALGPGIAEPRHGYLRVEDIPDAEQALTTLRQRFDQVRIGLHDDVEVVLGSNWGGPVTGARRIAQSFTAAMALAYSGARPTRVHLSLAQGLLRAGFLGTLLGALTLGKRRALLTLIGAGVFGNPPDLVWQSILWAVDEVRKLNPPALDVVVNGYHLAEKVPVETIQAGTRARHGAVVSVDHGTVRVVE